ncbi:MAG: EthD family reductase [Alphaproteobacteria bacterium]
MLKFLVVLYRRADLDREAFRAYLRDVHGPLAERLPGLCRYVQNMPAADPRRAVPAWDAVVELYFGDSAAMEAAWASPEGEAATDDLAQFVDLARTTWSVVDERQVR